MATGPHKRKPIKTGKPVAKPTADEQLDNALNDDADRDPSIDRGVRVKVRALKTGYYDHVRRRGPIGDRPGDVFIAYSNELGSWMELVDDPTVPVKVTGAGAALKAQRQDAMVAKVAAKAGEAQPPAKGGTGSKSVI